MIAHDIGNVGHHDIFAGPDMYTSLLYITPRPLVTPDIHDLQILPWLYLKLGDKQNKLLITIAEISMKV